MTSHWYFTCFLFVSMGLGGCLGESLGPERTLDVPDAWHAPWAVSGEVVAGWLGDFAAPQLDTLVAQALRESPDLRSAALKIDAARQRMAIASGSLWPGVSLDGEVRRSGPEPERTVHGIDGTISWEIDLWRRLSLNRDVAQAELKGAEAEWCGARFSLAANVARGWFRVVELEGQIQQAGHNLDLLDQSLKIIEERYRGGLTTPLDLRLARTDRAQGEEQLAARGMEWDAAQRTLETLLGRYPEGRMTTSARALPRLSRQVPAGLPAQLLDRRCDLKAARQQLTGTRLRFESARRNRLPTIRLTTTGGMASDALRDLLDWDNLVWSMVGGLTQPLFQGGRLRAEEALARVEHRQAWSGYAKAVLVAFREVETTLAATTLLAEREHALEGQVREARKAVQEAMERYREGLTDILTLLETERRLFQAESARLGVARAVLDNRVSLHLALGGDFAE
ncbi:MAG: TolC family protein [Magnetococcales bacterium]|nr:TolC family protein [Magnetococcales bacterium]